MLNEGHPSDEPPLSSALRVLIVDDNTDAATSLGILLEMNGATVRVVHDGPAALDSLEDFGPIVALLDLGMPGMDGCEVARRIRGHPRFSQLLLVAQTGWGNEECRRLTTDAGFDHHLVKPVDLNLLINLLARNTPGEGARSA